MEARRTYSQLQVKGIVCEGHVREEARSQMKQEGLIIHGEECGFISKQGEATERIMEAWI